jgi:hypothetical protein
MGNGVGFVAIFNIFELPNFPLVVVMGVLVLDERT